MIKIKETVIVEGKYDKIRLSSLVDAVILETDGFRVFKDKEKQKLIRRMAETTGILILTDSDSAGFKIRSYLCGSIDSGSIKHAYIPDILGKEKRKTEISKEGKIGVEGMESGVILKALERSGISLAESKSAEKNITNYDFYEDGINGRKNSKSKRAALLKELDLPARLSSSDLLKVINIFMSYEEYKAVLSRIDNAQGDVND